MRHVSSARLGGRYAISVALLIAVGLYGCGGGGGSETAAGSGSATGSVTPCPPPFGICSGAGQGGSGGNAQTDNDDPSTPSGLSASAASPTQINLDWTDSTDNVAVTGYRVYRNGVLLATLGNVSAYQNTGLTAATTYSYTVQALDAAGNASAQSPAVIATTPTLAKLLHMAWLGDQLAKKQQAAAKAALARQAGESEVQPLQTVARRPSGAARPGLHDGLSADAWLKRRNEQLRKR